jgi:cytochrome c biogenesis protein CcdA
MAIASIGFAFIAGVLSSLSPCVLPILPLVLGAAVTEHKWGPVALAAGLALSFTIVGLFVAMIGFSIGLDAGVFRNIAAVILIGFGVVMLVPRLQERFAVAASGVSTWASDGTVGYAAHGLTGQLLLGVLLGTVWSPCVGPTLGAASILAAQGRDLISVVLTMLAFGTGAALPLLLLGLVSREAVAGWRNRLLGAGERGKSTLGVVAGFAGLVILTGFDKPLETLLVAASPERLIRLTTSF